MTGRATRAMIITTLPTIAAFFIFSLLFISYRFSRFCLRFLQPYLKTAAVIGVGAAAAAVVNPEPVTETGRRTVTVLFWRSWQSGSFRRGGRSAPGPAGAFFQPWRRSPRSPGPARTVVAMRLRAANIVAVIRIFLVIFVPLSLLVLPGDRAQPVPSPKLIIYCDYSGIYKTVTDLPTFLPHNNYAPSCPRRGLSAQQTPLFTRAGLLI